MVSKERADQISGGVFFIGLGLIFFLHWDFWPSILFVLGATTIARGMAEGQAWYNVTGGLWLFGLGVLFLTGFNWPLILILVGATMLFGYSFRPKRVRRLQLDDDGEAYWEKPKNDEKYKNDDLEDSSIQNV